MKVPELSIEESKKRERVRAEPSRNAFAYTIQDAQKMGGPGKTKMYELAKEGRLNLVHVDGRTLVSGDSLRALLGVEEN
jgi:hypothetical protein